MYLVKEKWKIACNKYCNKLTVYLEENQWTLSSGSAAGSTCGVQQQGGLEGSEKQGSQDGEKNAEKQVGPSREVGGQKNCPLPA